MERLGAKLAAACVAAVLFGTAAKAETPEEWVKLGARVHGGYGAFIPLGVRIGLDAVATLKAQPRQLAVTYFDNPKSPCACFLDGVALATVASVGQRTVTIAPEAAPDDAAAVILIRPRQGGPGLRYVVPMRVLPTLQGMNKALDPLARHHAVMAADGLFERFVDP